MSELEYEYGIRHIATGELWRGPWTYDKASEWLREAYEDGFKIGVFELVKRPKVYNWEAV